MHPMLRLFVCNGAAHENFQHRDGSRILTVWWLEVRYGGIGLYTTFFSNNLWMTATHLQSYVQHYPCMFEVDLMHFLLNL